MTRCPSPGGRAPSPHIVLDEAGIRAKLVKVDLARWPMLAECAARLAARPAAQPAMRAEGLLG